MKYYSIFAQSYGQGSYGDCAYNTADQCTVSAGGTTGNSTGNLANTGTTALILILTLACLIVLVALLVRIWRRKPAAQEVQIQDAEPEEAKRLSGRF